MTKFLIVDDDELSLRMLRVLLEAYGYQVLSAQNGAEALGIARREPPDIIVSDILMPEMDGFTLCREWKQDSVLKAIPFIFYTATYTGPDNEKFALGLGAERFVVKTIEPEDFIEILQEVLGEHENGKGTAPYEAVVEPDEYFKGYSTTLLRKLAEKTSQLEQTRKQTDQQRLELAQAREKTAELQRFVGGAADALKAPLSTMKTSLQLLRQATDLESSQQYLEILDAQIVHLEKLLDDMQRMAARDEGAAP